MERSVVKLSVETVVIQTTLHVSRTDDLDLQGVLRRDLKEGLSGALCDIASSAIGEAVGGSLWKSLTLLWAWATNHHWVSAEWNPGFGLWRSKGISYSRSGALDHVAWHSLGTANGLGDWVALGLWAWTSNHHWVAAEWNPGVGVGLSLSAALLWAWLADVLAPRLGLGESSGAGADDGRGNGEGGRELHVGGLGTRWSM